MHLRTRRVAFLFAASFLSGAAFVAACSSDNGTTNVFKFDAGKADTSTTTTDGASDEDADTDTDAAADCGAAPKLRSNTGPYCFGGVSNSDAGDAGDAGTHNGSCDSTNDEICCSGGRVDGGSAFYPSACKASPTSGDTYNSAGVCTYGGGTGSEWQCSQKSHCPGTGSCCLLGSSAGSPIPGADNQYPGCGTFFQSTKYINGAKCRTTCAAGEQQLCASDADCTAGKCVALSVDGRFTGYCRISATP